MGGMYHNGHFYGGGGTAKVMRISDADYLAMKQAGTLDPNTAYFRYDAPSVYPEVQDDGTATDLADGKIQTGRTIESYINKNLRTADATGVITKLTTSGTLDMNLCVKIGDIVIASARVHTINPTVAASGDFFQLPAGFRPPRITYGAGAMNVNSTNFYPVMSKIGTDGKVHLGYSAGAQTAQVWFFAVFSVV